MHQEGQDGRRRRKKRFFLIFPNLPCSIIKSKKGSAIFLWDSLSDSHKDHSATAQERLKKIPSCPLGQLKRFRQWLQGFQGYAPVFPLTLAFPSWADIYPTHMLSVVWLHRNSTRSVCLFCGELGSAEHLQDRRTITPPSTPSSLARKGELMNLFCIVSNRAW